MSSTINTFLVLCTLSWTTLQVHATPQAAAKFSPATLQDIKTATGLDAEQVDNIMKVVNKPEQDSLDWPNYYGYCQNIHDGRGVTMDIFGATTGGPNDTGPDGPSLFMEFDKLSGATSPSPLGGVARAGITSGVSYTNNGLLIFTKARVQKQFCRKVKALASNPVWRQATWNVFLGLYWNAAVTAAKNRGYSSALTIGALVDCALNEGTQGVDSLDWILSHIDSSYPTEADFLQAFLAKRTTVVDTHQFNQPPNGQHRVEQWSQLLSLGDMDLKNCDADIIKVTTWVMH